MYNIRIIRIYYYVLYNNFVWCKKLKFGHNKCLNVVLMLNIICYLTVIYYYLYLEFKLKNNTIIILYSMLNIIGDQKKYLTIIHIICNCFMYCLLGLNYKTMKISIIENRMIFIPVYCSDLQNHIWQ